MKMITRLAILLAVIMALAWPGSALAGSLHDDKVVFGGSYTLRTGETLDGDLLIFGGIATLETGSQVDGDVVLMGGTLQASGEVNGSVVAIGGLVDLESTAVIQKDVVVLGAHLGRAQGARVEGDVVTGLPGPMSFTFPGGAQVPRLEFQFSPILDAFWFMFRAFLWAALAVLLVLFLPKNVEKARQAAVSQPVIAGGLGLLTIVVAPVVLLVLLITIILSPVSLLAGLALAMAWGFGLITLGLEVGDRLAELLKQDWAPALTAGAGTFILVVVLNGLQAVVPCLGWIFPTLVGMVGLGAVLLTRLGTQAYIVTSVAPATLPPVVQPEPEPTPPSDQT